MKNEYTQNINENPSANCLITDTKLQDPSRLNAYNLFALLDIRAVEPSRSWIRANGIRATDSRDSHRPPPARTLRSGGEPPKLNRAKADLF